MAGAAHAGVATASAEYEEVLGCLGSLITQKVRADTGNRGNQWQVMAKYVQDLTPRSRPEATTTPTSRSTMRRPQRLIQGLSRRYRESGCPFGNPVRFKEPIAQLKVVPVAGTKGKGSTCTFAESILRSCGFRTGLFTSPHLMDVRERFRLDGLDISEDKFIRYFWWCWNKLKDKTGDDVPMPAYFRFLALLAFKIFSDEKVDVAVLEVGLGGKYDATNVKGVPAYTVPQPEEAMSVLMRRASELGVSLQVVQPLDPQKLEDQPLGLHGEHQYMNAGLAVALANTWLEKQGHLDRIHAKHSETLPHQFIKGLSSARLQGRAQIVPDLQVNSENDKDGNSSLVFYLDGAHSPESMETCARWFVHVTNNDRIQLGSSKQPHADRNSRKGSTLSRPYLCQTNHSTTSLVPLHHHLQSVRKLICHGSYHSKGCGKACLITMMVVLNFIVKLCLAVSICFLTETT
ncbi:hypothetical protein PVAP13_9NG252000 [Panicum virgatum]|uniref:Folylpolyglutamate synthase n=1 Tax=Panicum virgatum TaxID=38727 RepID=A0A8T0MLE4_PANVG|nr:hypothetical protein PVAP13_9NG252000 [Panicum virgatum]